MDNKSASPPANDPPDPLFYRFGICGLTAGGKTCLLAALALPRVAHPQSLTATVMPATGKSSPHLKAGWKWVNDARDALLVGALPPPNTHGTRCTIRYKFTDGKQREVFIELVDYSGELLDSSLSQDELASQLHAYLAEVDGFLFVAEHPKPGEQPGELGGYLLHLKEALASLSQKSRGKKSGASRVPIALLVNKWDRSGRLSRTATAHEEETLRLKNFLETSPLPPHAGLLDELNAASEKSACRAFPVSAFGEAVRVPGEHPGEFIERPASVKPELPSFGLEEPFLWLVEQRDHLDADAIAATTSAPWLWVRPWVTRHGRKQAGQIGARISRASPEEPRVRRAKQKLLWCRALQLFLLFAALLSTFLLGEYWVDKNQLQGARSAVVNPADPNGRKDAARWFTEYIEAGPWRHLICRTWVLSNAAAAAELQDALSRIDDEAWEPVLGTPDEATRATLALRYLEDFPQGKHSQSAKQIVEVWGTKVRRGKLRAQLQDLENPVAKIKMLVDQRKETGKGDLAACAAKLGILGRDVSDLKNMEVADEELTTLQQSVLKEIGRLDAQISGMLASDKIRQDYFDYTERGLWEKAGRYLAGLDASTFDDLRTDFRNKALSQIEPRAMEVVGNGAAWSKGLDFVRGFESVEIRPLLPKNAAEHLDNLKSRIEMKGDRYLYAKCNSLAGSEHFTEYLETAPLKTMETVVKEWLHYHDLRNKRNTYRVGVAKISWDAKAKDVDSTWTSDSLLSIELGAGKARQMKFYSDRKEEWNPGRGSEFWAEAEGVLARDPQQLILQVWDVDWPDGNDDLGSLKDAGLLEQFDGRVFQLNGSDYGPNHVTLWVEVLDGNQWRPFKKPEMPRWEARR